MRRLRARWWFLLGGVLVVIGLVALRSGARVGVVALGVAVLLVSVLRVLDDGPEGPNREPPIPPGA